MSPLPSSLDRRATTDIGFFLMFSQTEVSWLFIADEDFWSARDLHSQLKILILYSSLKAKEDTAHPLLMNFRLPEGYRLPSNTRCGLHALDLAILPITWRHVSWLSRMRKPLGSVPSELKGPLSFASVWTHEKMLSLRMKPVSQRAYSSFSRLIQSF